MAWVFFCCSSFAKSLNYRREQGWNRLTLRDLGESVITPLCTVRDVIRVALALVPVLLFLAALRALDSYKLVSSRAVFAALAAGALAAVLCFAINTSVFRQFPGYQDQYARFGAPVVEELAKAVYWIFLIATARGWHLWPIRLSAVSPSARDSH